MIKLKGRAFLKLVWFPSSGFYSGGGIWGIDFFFSDSKAHIPYLFDHPFIHLLNEYLLTAHYVLGILLCLGL